MPKILDDKQINERTLYLLKVLVDRYIREGQPIGSRTLSRTSELELSPASIRNIMADLEEMGLIRAPHTSAGRVPTVRGYRVFLDSLLQLKPVSGEDSAYLRQQLQYWETDSQGLLSQTSSLLSELTHFAGVVTVPRKNTQILRQVEFLGLSDPLQVLVVLVLNEREVRHRVIHTTRHYSSSELQQAANYLTQKFIGQDLKQVRQQLIQEVENTHQHLGEVLQIVREMAEKAFEDKKTSEGDFFLSGQTNLLDQDELSDIEKLREIFEIFTRKRDILHLLDQALEAQGVQTFVGAESGCQELDSCSLVTSPYWVNGKVAGVIGVIGPTRMPYARVIPLVDMTAQLLGSTLQQLHL